MESFKVTHLTNHVNTQWGQLYSSIRWNCFWDNILKQVEKEYTECDYIHLPNKQRQKTLAYVIYWFDINILQKFPLDDTRIKDETFDVNMRIVCGMVNNLNYDNDFKIKVVECFHDAFKRFYIEWMNWRCLRIWGLPF